VPQAGSCEIGSAGTCHIVSLSVLSPALSVHQAIVIVLVSASGFSMIGPRVIVTAAARPAITSPAATRRRVFARIKAISLERPGPGMDGCAPLASGRATIHRDRQGGNEKSLKGAQKAPTGTRSSATRARRFCKHVGYLWVRVAWRGAILVGSLGAPTDLAPDPSPA